MHVCAIITHVLVHSSQKTVSKMTESSVLYLSDTPYQDYERAFSNQHSPTIDAPLECEPNGTSVADDHSQSPDDTRTISTPSTSSSRLSTHDTLVKEEYHRTHTPTEADVESTKSNPVSMTRRRRIAGVAKVAGMIVLAISLAGLLSVPVAIFVRTFKSSTTSLTISSFGTQSSSSSNSNTSLSNATQCSAEIYTGSVCQEVLLKRQSCIPGRETSSDVFVTAPQSEQAVLEPQFGLLFQLVPEMSEQCGDELLAFLCVEAFMGLCDPSGSVQSTSSQDCERITSATCAAEFQIIEPILIAGGIQRSCSSLPQQSTICSSHSPGTGSGSGSSPPANTTVSEIQRNCSDGFFVDDNGLCAPECGVWWPRTPTEFRVLTIPNSTFAAVGLVITVIVIILSCLQHKKVFRFPAIFTLYQLLSLLPMIGMLLLSYVDIKGLMCGSRNLIINLMPGNETPLCSIVGSSVFYFTTQVALWWIFHLTMIFISVFWPFKYQYWRNSGYLKYIHIAMVIVGLILPIVPVIVNFTTGGYALNVFYPPQCIGRSQNGVFYSLFLPVMSVVAIGIFFLVLIIWKLVSEEIKIKQDSTKRQVEIKLILLLLSYVIVWTVFIGVSVFIVIESPEYINTLVDYFLCEATGTGDCSTNVFQQFSVVPGLILNVASLYPATFLIYFINVKRIKNFTRLNNLSSTAVSTSVSS